ncbi:MULTISPECIES: polyphenol oxidase family protein [unclassified Psychrobacter]|uniref:polyphenol oxidase family protein n=1 Tax=unclassified Psychrobacter TaxID=196806 RepID=UPI0025B5E127|nr:MULTISPECIES: polyphenol oxidase family protein [unclassified Psychrobacter]MDN3453528.1 polyphenol oxidase family protein [Psychrobacter sp. APC 3350]MDN3503153.1 polyphenol oxidase family protein [Psychrobacter sp. 5A.1]
MINKLPMTMLAQIDDVAIFQTAAFVRYDIDEPAAKNKRMGQQGQSNYGELNLGLHVNDDALQALDNRMSLLAAINEQLADESAQTEQSAAINRLHWVSQVHGNHVHDIDAIPLSMAPVSADAMVSQQTGCGLAIMTADCVPIVLYQPSSGKIAAIHAGWQGLACGVIQETTKRFTESGAIQAWIGVCISQANYEVDTGVRDKLLAGCIANQTLAEKHIDDFVSLFSIPSQHDKIKLNLPRLAAMQLENAGITVVSDVPVGCSYADTYYYSYRRQTHLQQPATGRMALVIVRR